MEATTTTGASTNSRLERVVRQLGIAYTLTISAKPVGVGVMSQRLIATGEQSGLLTRIAIPGSVSLCVRIVRFDHLACLIVNANHSVM